MNFRYLQVTLLLALLLNSFLAGSAFANGTSYFQSSELPTGNVLPMEEGKVGIEREELTIRLRKNNKGSILSPENPALKAAIKVVYQLHNHLHTDIQVPIAFPHPGETDHWKVTVDGREIPLTGFVSIPRDQLMGETPHNEWVHPRTGEKYHIFRRDQFSQFNEILSKTFTVSLQGDTTHSLQVEYEASLGFDEKTSLHPVYRLDYLLHPASYWSDFKNLQMQLEVPFDAEVYTNLPLNKISSHSWEGNFQLLPEEDLAVFVSPDSGWVIDLFDSRGKALGCLLVLVILFYPIGRWGLSLIPLRHRSLVSLSILVVFIWAGYDILQHKIFGYPLTMLHPFFFAWYVSILFFLWKRIRVPIQKNALSE
jgi:hypothetical protein